MTLTRRETLLTVIALPWAGLFARPAIGRISEADLTAAIRALVGDAPIVDGGVTLRLPEVAENGAQVPLSVLVDSPMNATDYVTAIHILATRNPTPGIASFYLSPVLARAEAQTRIRIAEAQEVIALAVHADGRVRRAVVALRVTTGGCLS